MRATRFFVIVLILLVTAALPSTARSDDPSADFALTQEVYDGEWNPVEGSPDLVIPERMIFKYYVRNNGPDTAPYTFRFTIPNTGIAYYDPAHIAWSRFGDGCDIQSWSPVGFSVTCPGDSLLFADVAVDGNAPGLLSVSAAVAGHVPDPQESNNSATWESSVVCSIMGTPADDVFTGTEDVDSICGGDGNDYLVAVGSDDKLFGEGGDDTFAGTRGDTWGEAVGGPGDDTVTYENATHQITICRESQLYSVNLSSWAPDRLVDIERYVGSPYRDVIEGTNGTDVLIGRAGKDRLVGLRGHDHLNGGRGEDKFITRDSTRDVIRGGVGYDRVRADTGDRVFSAQRVPTEPFVNPCDG